MSDCRVRGNGTVKSYSYDAASRLASLSEDLAGAGSDLTQSFTYNPASQIATATRSNDAYAWSSHYNLTRNYGSNGLNQYTASGPVTPTYDARGNLTSAGSTTYAYNSDNLLTHKSGADIANYDGLMRLSRIGSAGQPATKFNYDGVDLIGEYDGVIAGISMLRRYVHGPGADEPLVWYEGSGTNDRRFLHSDERGSIIATSNSAGTLLSTNSYDESGIPGSGNSGRFQYTGQAWLPELGMYYYKARLYSPTLGRFLQTDPIGYGDGMNMYAYVGGDPVNATDPTGLRCTVRGGNMWDVFNGATGEYVGTEMGPTHYTFMGCEGGFPNYRRFQMDTFVTAGDGGGGGGGGGEQEIVVTATRKLSDNEKRIFQCNGVDSFHLDRIQLHSGIRLPERLAGMSAITYDSSNIHYRDGYPDVLSVLTSHSTLFLLAEEIGHTVQYTQGMTWPKYFGELLKNGYENNMYELIARTLQVMWSVHFGQANVPNIGAIE